jgi:hypothetical protein
VLIAAACKAGQSCPLAASRAAGYPSRPVTEDHRMMSRQFNPHTRFSPRPLTVEPSPDPAAPMSTVELIACAKMVAKGLAIDTVEARRLRLAEGTKPTNLLSR